MNDNKQYLRLKLGVSACLLGKQVRFDGGHKRNRYITDQLNDYADIVSVCPEAEIGLGIPRPPIQLRLVNKDVRLVVSQSPDQDLTDKMQDYSQKRTRDFADLDGFIFKKDSPSCGVFRVPVVQNEDGIRSRDGTGMFAQAFMERYPLIPIEEEGRLNDPALRENFFECVYSYRRWKEMLQHDADVNGLIQFHSRHKLLLMARGSSYYTQLGRLVASTTRTNLRDNQQAYISLFMSVMSKKTRRGQQVNVMQHVLGHLKKRLSSDDKQELLSIFESYRQSTLPLITPITMLRHYVRKSTQSFLREQYYFDPYPENLALRSSI